MTLKLFFRATGYKPVYISGEAEPGVRSGLAPPNQPLRFERRIMQRLSFIDPEVAQGTEELLDTVTASNSENLKTRD
jgi:hypothetical protein